ncbi:unnamed protein product [Cylindrotheca closterium]|uniref:Subtilisin n=1 Tax=Cylindrotheca closterium TaxID=2856 RepID=A0AAD2CK91_9STRA|nr:unnamed protein product [Cylindrotheca closterium]
MKLLLSLALTLVAANPAAAQCDYDFCAGNIQYPTAVAFNDATLGDVSCDSLPLGISAGLLTDEQCTNLPQIELICCPPDGPFPCGNTTIEFCPDGIPDPNLIINPEDPPEDQGPCSFVVVGLSAGVLDAEECSDILALQSICCPSANVTMPPNITMVPNSTEAPVATEPPTEEETAGGCFLCGSDVPYANDKTWIGESVCNQLSNLVDGLSSGEFCDSLLTDDQLNFQSFCECEGAVAPDFCTLCPAGQEIMSSRAVPGFDGGVTCGEGASYVTHILDASLCGNFATPEVVSACCVDPEGAVESSGGMSVTISGFASALLVALTFSS